MDGDRVIGNWNGKETQTRDGSMSRSVLDRDDRIIAIMSNVSNGEKGGGPKATTTGQLMCPNAG